MNEINSIADSDFNYHRNQADFALKKNQFSKILCKKGTLNMSF